MPSPVRNYQMLQGWELRDRALGAECHVHHVPFREETRWPGYLYRPDHPKHDDANWKHFVTSRYDADSGTWEISTKPVIQVVDSG